MSAPTEHVIAIDGPAGAGKSTTALKVAQALAFAYVDSGAFYRAATLIALRRGLAGGDRVDGPAIARAVEGMRIEQRVRNELNEVWLDGEEVGAALRAPEVTNLVSRIAAEPDVRHAVTAALRASATGRPLVMEGRDIGTAVFPHATLKVFLDASLEERARRRSAAEGRSVEARAIARRDEQDRTRRTAPLARAADAVVLAGDDLTLEEQVARIVALYRSAAASRP